jgi:Fe-S cluster assembly iron-binding protein IscA
MIVNIDEETALFLRHRCSHEEIIAISLIKAGCAGNMLSITKIPSKSLDSSFLVCTVFGLDIAVSSNVLEITNDITICKKQGLLAEIIVRNNSAVSTCRCGKSFC